LAYCKYRKITLAEFLEFLCSILEYKNKAEELFNNTILLKSGEPFPP
jgi:hypothetical protein